MRIKDIESPQNGQLKSLLLLQEKSRERLKTGLFVLEGLRELGLALAAGYEVVEVYFSEAHTPMEMLAQHFPTLLDGPKAPLWIRCKSQAFAKIAYREGIPNVVALCKQAAHQLSDLNLPENPLILVLEGVEKPGNIGAMLRTSEAAAIDAVLLCDARADVYNPNAIRSSVGGLFSNQIAVCEPQEAIDFLRKKGLRIYASYLEAAEFYHNCDFTQGSALVMGTEATGISPIWLEAADQRIKIPMLGRVDSMNVSNAAAILMYEAQRQRNFGFKS